MMRRIRSLATRDRAAWATITVFYVATRLALLWRFPPHVDESLYATWTVRGYERVDSVFIPLTRGQQPLLEWVGIVFMHAGAGPLTAVRLVSFVSGLGTLFLVGYLGRRLGGRPTALAAGALFVVVPFFLVYTTIGLYDPLATFFVTAAVTLTILVAERPRLVTALALGVALGGGLLTKLTTELSFALLPFGALFVDWRGGRRGRRLARWVGYLAVSVAIAWGLYQVLRLSRYYDGLGAARQVFARHSVADFVHDPGRWLAANGRPYGWALLGYLTIPVLVAIALGAFEAARSRRPFAILLGAWAVIPLAVAVTLADIPYVRWLDTGMPPLVLLGGYGAVVAFQSIRRRRLSLRRRNAAVAGAVALLVIPALAWDARTLASPLMRAYPGNDDVDYVRGASGGGPWLRLVPDLRHLSDGRPLTVAWSGLEALEYVQLAIRHDRQITLVESDSLGAQRALVGFGNGTPLATAGDGLVWRRIRIYPRPRGGVPVVLYRHGVRFGGSFAASPAGLRALSGGERAYRRYLAEHPAVRAWARAWHRAQP